LVAEANNVLVGSTTRLPFHIRLQDGSLLKGAFSVNSMVHPKYRGRGIIGALYKKSFDYYPFLFSKGTAETMYTLLLSYGYMPVEPNTYYAKILAPIKWLFWRSGYYKPKILPWKDIATDGFALVKRFGKEHSRFFFRIAHQFGGLLNKNATYLNWRYIDIPFREYSSFVRLLDNKIVSWVILGAHGSTGTIVDILWDRNVPAEPEITIKFATRYLADHGFIKARCWSSMSFLRTELQQAGFKAISETPHFSYFAKKDLGLNPSILKTWLICDGDGDSEYLG
jgi:hypothetical protein